MKKEIEAKIAKWSLEKKIRALRIVQGAVVFSGLLITATAILLFNTSHKGQFLVLPFLVGFTAWTIIVPINMWIRQQKSWASGKRR